MSIYASIMSIFIKYLHGSELLQNTNYNKVGVTPYYRIWCYSYFVENNFKQPDAVVCVYIFFVHIAIIYIKI